MSWLLAATLALIGPAGDAAGPTHSLPFMYRLVSGFVVQAAEQMPEAEYGFRPSPDIRPFGAIVGHVADANYFFCSRAAGEDNPNKASLEKLTGKAALVDALKRSVAYCEAVYAKDDAGQLAASIAGGPPVSTPKQEVRPGAPLAFNMAHTYEHYGNLAVYMRLKGLTPPSTAAAQRTAQP